MLEKNLGDNIITFSNMFVLYDVYMWHVSVEFCAQTYDLHITLNFGPPSVRCSIWQVATDKCRGGEGNTISYVTCS